MRIGRTWHIATLALGLFGFALSAVAQPPTKVPRIGILSDEPLLMAAKSFEPFARGLRDLGYIEGQNISFEHRYAAGDYEVLPNLAAELIGLHPDVILAVGTPAARAAKTAAPTIPIVFARISDPIGVGLASSLARPGGNLTGVSILSRETAAKRLELLITAVPDTKRAGLLWQPNFPPASPQFREVEGAARSLNLDFVPVGVHGPDDFEPALRAMVEQRVGAVMVLYSPMFRENIHRVPDLMVAARLPSVFPTREDVEAGGLMSYATDYNEMFRRAAVYVDKILKGAKPADLPVEQPTKFELVINLKTAETLGLTIPPMLLARADQVIE